MMNEEVGTKSCFWDTVKAFQMHKTFVRPLFVNNKVAISLCMIRFKLG